MQTETAEGRKGMVMAWAVSALAEHEVETCSMRQTGYRESRQERRQVALKGPPS